MALAAQFHVRELSWWCPELSSYPEPDFSGTSRGTLEREVVTVKAARFGFGSEQIVIIARQQLFHIFLNFRGWRLTEGFLLPRGYGQFERLNLRFFSIYTFLFGG